MQKCQSMDRNFCAPNEKNAALFVDVDGTILVCQPYFDEAAESFGYFMALRGFDKEQAKARLAQVDHEKTEREGFERDRFGKSLIDAYRSLVKEKRRRFTVDQQKQDEIILRQIGMGPFFREPQLFANAAAVLGRAHHNFLIFAVSIGNREAQKYKVRQAGLDPVFDELIITARDDKAEIVAGVIRDWNIDPALSAFIGNSKRSDGANLAVTNFVYLPLEAGWAFDQTRELPQSDFEMFSVKDWREAEEKAINRLVRRRKAAKGGR
jgi:FMN phosphatase YigB (HAD superfamily)